MKAHRAGFRVNAAGCLHACHSPRHSHTSRSLPLTQRESSSAPHSTLETPGQSAQQSPIMAQVSAFPASSSAMWSLFGLHTTAQHPCSPASTAPINKCHGWKPYLTQHVLTPPPESHQDPRRQQHAPPQHNPLPHPRHPRPLLGPARPPLPLLLHAPLAGPVPRPLRPPASHQLPVRAPIAPHPARRWLHQAPRRGPRRLGPDRVHVGRHVLDVWMHCLGRPARRLGLVGHDRCACVQCVLAVRRVQRLQGRRWLHGCRWCATAWRYAEQEAGEDGEERRAEGCLPVSLESRATRRVQSGCAQPRCITLGRKGRCVVYITALWPIEDVARHPIVASCKNIALMIRNRR